MNGAIVHGRNIYAYIEKDHIYGQGPNTTINILIDIIDDISKVRTCVTPTQHHAFIAKHVKTSLLTIGICTDFYVL